MINNLNFDCRLCSGDTQLKFSEKILNKYSIKFLECKNCKSLQTENPYWLKESYNEWNTKFDTGVFSRVEKTSLLTIFLCKFLKFKNIIDYGGGDGLFCRILRDYNFNCNTYDKYSKNIYSKNYDDLDQKNLDLLTSFEAIEHFEKPKEEFEKIFSMNPKALLLTTSIYKDQDNKWNYLELATGQHIFFYSKRALQDLSKKYNYHIYFLESGFILMTSDQFNCNKFKIFLLKKLLVREKFFYILRFFRIFLNPKGYEKDYINLKKKL